MAQYAVDEEDEQKKTFARILMITSKANKCTKIFPVLKFKKKNADG